MSDQRKRSSRYPTCGRAPSRRLLPELFLSSQPPPIQDEETVTEHTVTLSQPRPSSLLSAAFDDDVSPSIQQDSDEESSVTSSADSENESSIVRVPVPLPLRILPLAPMAVSVQKFIAPPVFSASPEEDAVDWLERYELVATYNRWSDPDNARNFVMYLEGTTRKWFLVQYLL